MGAVFDRPYAPSTLGSFLREYAFGHLRQLDAVVSRFFCGLAEAAPIVAEVDGRVMIDIDDSIIEVHRHGQQGSGYGFRCQRLELPDHPPVHQLPPHP